MPVIISCMHAYLLLLSGKRSEANKQGLFEVRLYVIIYIYICVCRVVRWCVATTEG